MLNDFLEGNISVKIHLHDFEKCKALSDILHKTFHSCNSLSGRTMQRYLEEFKCIWIYNEENYYDQPGHSNSIYYDENLREPWITIDDFLEYYDKKDKEIEDSEFYEMFGE